MTDMDGKFVLSVPQDASLLISYIGYMDRTVLVGDSSEISVRLSENTQALEEVVVVGYGTQKK